MEYKDKDRLVMNLLLAEKIEFSEKEIDFFPENQEDIDKITAPVNLHKLFLWMGTLFGIILLSLSKNLVT